MYYMETLHYAGDAGGDHLSVAVSMEKVKYSNAKVGGAVDETQRISLTSTYLTEKQVCNEILLLLTIDAFFYYSAF